MGSSKAHFNLLVINLRKMAQNEKIFRPNYQYVGLNKQISNFHCFRKAATHEWVYEQQNNPWQGVGQGSNSGHEHSRIDANQGLRVVKVT